MGNRKVKDLAWMVATNNLNALFKEGGLNLFLVDTSTVIDLERAYNNNGHSSGNAPVHVLAGLERQGMTLVTPGVYKEMRQKRMSRRGNRFEISGSTAELLHGLNDTSTGTFDASDLNNPEYQQLRDYHRYAVRSAAYQTFFGDSRKGEKDKIGDEDVEMITTALDLSRMSLLGQPVVMVNVLSSDSHVTKTIHTLKTEDSFEKHFGDYPVRGIDTRNDMRSYIER